MQKINTSMISKASEKNLCVLYQSLMAGISIGLGGLLFTLILGKDPYNTIFRVIASASFSTGLIIIIIFKFQLFTGNNLFFLPILKKEITFWSLIKNWILVYIGNFIGAIIFIALIFPLLPTHIEQLLSSITSKKVSLPYLDIFIKAIFCNILVCIAVVLATIATKFRYKIFGIIMPITLFVFLGFEHSIANMFFLPIGLVKAHGISPEVISPFIKNIIPVSAGNIVGGLLVSICLFVFSKKNAI